MPGRPQHRLVRLLLSTVCSRSKAWTLHDVLFPSAAAQAQAVLQNLTRLTATLERLQGHAHKMEEQISRIASAATATANESSHDDSKVSLNGLRNLAELRAKFPNGVLAHRPQALLANIMYGLASTALVAAASCRTLFTEWENYDQLFAMPPESAGLFLGRISKAISRKTGPGSEQSRDVHDCNIDMGHGATPFEINKIVSTPTHEYHSECPVLWMRSNQYFATVLLKNEQRNHFLATLQRISERRSFACESPRLALVRSMGSFEPQRRRRMNASGSNFKAGQSNAFNELSRVLFRPHDVINARVDYEIKRVRTLLPKDRLPQSTPGRSAASSAQGDWRHTAAVIGVQIRGSMLCEGEYFIRDRTSPHANGTKCFQRFDWTGCVRRLEAQAKAAGYPAAHVYLATDTLALRKQAEKHFGDILADPPSNRGKYGEGSDANTQRIAMQELVTLARSDAFVFFSKTPNSSKSDSTYAQMGASWAAGRVFDPPLENVAKRRPYLGVFTVNPGSGSCLQSWSEEAVEPFAHDPGKVNFYRDRTGDYATTPTGRSWQSVGSRRPLNVAEEVMGGPLQLALESGKLRFTKAEWSSFGIDLPRAHKGMLTTVYAGAAYFQPSGTVLDAKLRKCGEGSEDCPYPSMAASSSNRPIMTSPNATRFPSYVK